MEINKRNDELILYEKYSPEKYPKYDNYDAINVNKVKEIPMDYEGIIGVPNMIIDNLNLKQFELLGSTRYGREDGFGKSAFVNGKETYVRLFIKRKTLITTLKDGLKIKLNSDMSKEDMSKEGILNKIKSSKVYQEKLLSKKIIDWHVNDSNYIDEITTLY